MKPMQDVIGFIDTHRQRFVDDLIQWVRIPSVSSDPSRSEDVKRNAEHLASQLRALGADRVDTWPTAGHPAVFAEWVRAPRKPTLLVYGHHDVQPVDPLDEWVSPPFEPTVRNGRLWGRGVVDDKGQVYIHVKAVESFIRTAGALPINLKMIVEGEEEIGSANLDSLMRDHAADLAADFVCVSDTAMFGRGLPSLCVGLRGLVYLEVFVDGPALDLHSGTFGGGVMNPIHALAKMIAALHDEDGRVTVPGFYDAVLPISDVERREIAALPFDEGAWLRSTGAPATWGERGYSTLERVWARLSKAFGRPTVFMREGGSIPFVRTIADATGKPCLLMGFGQPDENAHAPNEWLDLDNYHLGIKSAAYLYDELARM
jgi:acetylornithine deacetylase/succinyl-diaminopimelate desuccinylase-like protein